MVPVDAVRAADGTHEIHGIHERGMELMLTNQLTKLLAITGLIGLVACGEDKDDNGTTNITTVTVGDDGSESGSDDSATDPSATMTDTDPSATMTDSDPTATATDTDVSDSDPTATDTGSECPVDAECQTAADCDFGVMCVDCMCEGGDSTGGNPTNSDYGPCDMCAPGEMPVGLQDIEGCFCSPGCDGEGAMCPAPNDGTAQAICALILMEGAPPSQCALACDPTMQMCPAGATCSMRWGAASSRC